MKIRTWVTAILMSGVITVLGCESDVIQNDQRADNAAPVVVDDDAIGPSGNESEASVTDSWELYTPPEEEFSVMAPANSVEVKENSSKVGTFRTYVFKKGEAFLSVEIHSERKAPLNGNSVEELKSDTSEYVPGSVRDISLGEMPGIEFRMTGAIGESIFREYCTPDCSRTISIQVAKDHGQGFTDEEVKLFLNSFQLLD